MSQPAANTTDDRSGHERWHALADRILQGHRLSFDEGLSVLDAPDEQLLDLLSAVFRVRRRHFGTTVRLYFLMNAKSGLCSENCSYCSQSKQSKADIPRYDFVDRDRLLAGAEAAAERGAGTYCMVISARAPSEKEMLAVERIVPEIKRTFDLRVCVSLGMLNDAKAERLKACGVDRVNHNVNTSSKFYEEICTTHSYRDRVDTLAAVRRAGLELCSGGIIGLGEDPGEVVRMALELRELGVHAVPLNFLNPIEGTALAGADYLNPRYCLKGLALFRLANPTCELRIAGGREMHLGTMQSLGLYAADSIFVGDYLTTKGQMPEADLKMIREMGFQVEGPPGK